MPFVRSILLLALLGLTGCPAGCNQEMDHGGQNPDADAGASDDSDGGAAGIPCGDAGPPSDASPRDATPYDAGVPDASPYDASPYDASPYDAGPAYDAGPRPCGDAGPDDGA